MISQNKSLWCAEEETSLDLQGMSLSEEDIKVQIIILLDSISHYFLCKDVFNVVGGIN